MDLNQVVQRLKNQKSKKDVLKEAYSLTTERYYGKRLHTYWTAIRFFGSDPEKLWQHPGQLDCAHQNQLLASLLLGSGMFKKTDIQKRWTPYWGISPHQYLKVKIDKDEVINVDPWSSIYGIKLGDYSRWFHTKGNV
ncbi:MAG TPA: hypothetical protein VFT49_01815 [Candidatus Saccharimonadales bacterium]|nr:hypothetical protein [Candidatus Saccharimonadales bacterium]